MVFIHGKGGNLQTPGVNDYTFGGNFNRLKNLVAEAGGLYLSPDARFDDAGVARIEVLISDYVARSPEAPVVVACGSMGNAICYYLARPVLTAVISGYVVLSGYPDSGLLASPAVRQRKPLSSRRVRATRCSRSPAWKHCSANCAERRTIRRNSSGSRAAATVRQYG